MSGRVDDFSDRYGLVLALLLLTYTLASALPATPWSQAVLTAVQAVTAVCALRASGVPRRRFRRAASAGAVAVLVATATAIIGGRTGSVPALIDAILVAGAFVAIVRRIASHDHVSNQTLLGAMCCYVLFGLIYTFVYAALARLQSTPFFAPEQHQSLSDFLFFSFTTLTTTGYGDLVPSMGLGRALAMLEAISGQLFLVTVLARLVALWVPKGRQARERLRQAADAGAPGSSPSAGDDESPT